MQPQKPHIVMVIMDTARADNFSCYGYSRETSPHLDRIAEQGILFRNAITPSPWTLPAHVSLFTGLYPSEHGLTEDKIITGNNIYALSKDHDFDHFLPWILKKEGYKTIGFSNNPWVSKNFGFDKGFDFFFETWRDAKYRSGVKKIARTIRRLTPQRFHPALNNLKARISLAHHSDSGAEDTLCALKELLVRNSVGSKPNFIFINFMEPHLPYRPPEPYDRKFAPSGLSRRRISRVNQDHLKYIAGRAEMDSFDFEILQALYDGEIAYLDSKLEELFDFMDEVGLLDKALLVLTSDHGENIGEHSLMGHQFCLYDTLLRVPLIIKPPGFSIKGKIEDKYVQSSDIFYTLLDFLGIRIEGRTIRKRSFFNPDYAGYVVSEHEVPRISLFSLEKRFPGFQKESLDQELKCFYSEGMKYIWNSRKADELYDLKVDPREERNVAQERPDQAAGLFRRLKELIESIREASRKKQESPEFPKKEVDSQIKEKLRDLGYI